VIFKRVMSLRVPREGSKTKDITGVCRVWLSCFRGASPKDNAIIAEIDGYVRYGQRTLQEQAAASRSSPLKIGFTGPNTWGAEGQTIPVAEGEASCRRAITSWTAPCAA